MVNLVQPTCLTCGSLYCRSSYPDHDEHAEGEAVGGEPCEGEEEQNEAEVKFDVLDDKSYQLVLPSGQFTTKL